MLVSHHTGNASAWDLVRRGTWNFHKVTSATHLEARRLFRQACELDRSLAEAQFWTARVNAGLLAYGWSSDPDRDRLEGLDAALRAIYLDGQNPYSHYSLAIISAYSSRLHQAVLASERAIDLSPSFALGHLVLGMAHLFAGNANGAIEPLAYGLRLNPHDPQNSVWFNLLALAPLREKIPWARTSATSSANWSDCSTVCRARRMSASGAQRRRSIVADQKSPFLPRAASCSATPN